MESVSNGNQLRLQWIQVRTVEGNLGVSYQPLNVKRPVWWNLQEHVTVNSARNFRSRKNVESDDLDYAVV
jgi:hypothetical protein